MSTEDQGRSPLLRTPLDVGLIRSAWVRDVAVRAAACLPGDIHSRGTAICMLAIGHARVGWVAHVALVDAPAGCMFHVLLGLTQIKNCTTPAWHVVKW
jgi:hypothetical protein